MSKKIKVFCVDINPNNTILLNRLITHKYFIGYRGTVLHSYKSSWDCGILNNVIHSFLVLCGIADVTLGGFQPLQVLHSCHRMTSYGVFNFEETGQGKSWWPLRRLRFDSGKQISPDRLLQWQPLSGNTESWQKDLSSCVFKPLGALKRCLVNQEAAVHTWGPEPRSLKPR